MKMLFRAALALLALAASPALAQSPNEGKEVRLPAGYAPGTVIYCDDGTGKVAMCSFGTGGGSGGGAGTEYTEDAAAVANPIAPALNCRRRDTPSITEVSADGDWVTCTSDNTGALRVATHGVTATQSGTWTVGLSSAIPAGSNIIGSIANISGTISLPTGAATAANQVTANGSLVSIDTRLSGTVRVDTVAPSTATNRGGQFGTTAAQLMPANAARRWFTVQVQSASASCYISGQGTATADYNSLLIAAGAFYESSPHHVATGAISIICTGANTPVYAREG